MRFLLLSLLFFLFSFNLVFSLGVLPSHFDLVASPGSEQSFPVKILNNDGSPRKVVLLFEGDLASYLSVDNSLLSFSEGESEKVVTITINQPSSFPRKGPWEARLKVTELPSSSATVSAALSVSSVIRLFVPYDGVYAEGRLFVGEFKPRSPNDFVVEVVNLGSEDIADARAFFKVVSLDGSEVASLVSDSSRIVKGSKKLLSARWSADAPPGVYKVVATVVYDGQSFELQKIFSLGSPRVSIDDISVKDFSLGGIAKFDILVRNEWSDSLSGVHAEFSVVDSSGSKFANGVTQSVDLAPLSANIITAYWDTKNVVPGSYFLRLRVFFDDSVFEKTFPITVSQDKIDTGFSTGNVVSVSSGSSSDNGLLYLLVFLVALVLVVNLFLVRRLLKKN